MPQIKILLNYDPDTGNITSPSTPACLLTWSGLEEDEFIEPVLEATTHYSPQGCRVLCLRDCGPC